MFGKSSKPQIKPSTYEFFLDPSFRGPHEPQPHFNLLPQRTIMQMRRSAPLELRRAIKRSHKNLCSSKVVAVQSHN